MCSSSQCACRKSRGQHILFNVLHTIMQVSLLELAHKVIYGLPFEERFEQKITGNLWFRNLKRSGRHVQHEGYRSESPGRAGKAIGMIRGMFCLRRGVGGNESRCSIATAPGADLNKPYWRVISKYIVSKDMNEVCIEIFA